MYVAINDTVGRSPVYYARELWNNLDVNTRNIDNHIQFKTVIKKGLR